jgi:hypothetical protein
MRTSYATDHTRVGSNAGYGGLGQNKFEAPQATGTEIGNYPTQNRVYDNNGGVYR